MLSEEIKAIFLKKESKEYRKFGITMGSFLLILGLVFFFMLVKYDFFLMMSGILFLIGAFLFPVVLKPFFIIWMSFGAIMGFFMTRLILFLLYYLLFTPIGFLLRIFNVKLLEQKIDLHAESYWIMRAKKNYDPVSSEKQY